MTSTQSSEISPKTPRPQLRRTALMRSVSVAAALAGAVIIWAIIVPLVYCGESWHKPKSTLSPYRLELSTSSMPQDPPATSVRVRPTDSLTIVLRPLEATVGPIEVRAFLEQHGTTLRWPVHFERLPAGSFALTMDARELPVLDPGPWRATFLVGRPDRLPSSPDAARRPAPDDTWCMVQGELEVVGQPKTPAPVEPPP